MPFPPRPDYTSRMLLRLTLALAITLLAGCQERTLWTVGMCVRAGTSDPPPAGDHSIPLDRAIP